MKGGILLVSENQFIESQKECADMLGMSLSEYQNYCENLKVPTNKANSNKNTQNKTLEILEFLGIEEQKLKCRKDY